MEDFSHIASKGFEIQHPIGSGFYGVVYRAYQKSVDRSVAIKAIKPAMANNPKFIKDFEHEARIVANLQHPYIVPLFDYWREPKGAYLIMPLYERGNLRTWLQNQKPDKTKILTYFEALSHALGVAHYKGVVHQDIKAENILIDENENIYLSDFGIAEWVSQENESDERKRRKDITALGILLYEMATGEHIYEAYQSSPHRMPDIKDVAQFRDDLPAALNDVIQKAVGKNTDEFYENTYSFYSDLQHVLTGRTAHKPRIDGTPYKGLQPFLEADSKDFYGRERFVDGLLARMGQDDLSARFVPITGASGSGKSSVVRAGLISRLRRGEIPGSDNWYIIQMIPGTHPFQNLEAALTSIAQKTIEPDATRNNGLLAVTNEVLSDTTADIVLFIDQFEELFTLTEREETRVQFLDMLHTALTAPESRLRLILTLRADFMDRPLQYANFGGLFQQTKNEYLTAMTGDEIARAITGPLENYGVTIETALVTRITTDVQGEPGNLPLLQYTLTELYDNREGDTLKLTDYEARGSINGALVSQANTVYDSLPAEQHALVKQIFLRLITPDEEANYARRRTERREFDSLSPDRQVIENILEQFQAKRLLTFDRDRTTHQPTVEIAHEALIRHWDRLQQWLETSRTDLQIQQSFIAYMQEWQQYNKDNAYLLRGARLNQFEDWFKQTSLKSTDEEIQYFNESIAERERQQAIERERLAYEEKIAHRARNFGVAAALLGLAVIGALIGTYLLSQSAADSRRESNAANTNEAEAIAINATVESQATYFAMQQERAGTLVAGGIVVPVLEATPLREVYVATMTKIEELNQWEPEIQAFDGVEMVHVPAGCFYMGSLVEDDEAPIHEVCITEPFWLDRYEVSNGQFEQFEGEAELTPVWQGDDLPRTSVTWFEARDFCEKRGGRLPTEAEWEFAARGPDSLIFAWGNEFNRDATVYQREEPMPVGGREIGASWVGAEDLIANVWEWTSTIRDKDGERLWYPYDPNDGREGEVNPGDNVTLGLRGSAFRTGSSGGLRAANRNGNVPHETTELFGFRCARDFE